MLIEAVKKLSGLVIGLSDEVRSLVALSRVPASQIAAANMQNLQEHLGVTPEDDAIYASPNDAFMRRYDEIWGDGWTPPEDVRVRDPNASA